MHQLFMFIVKNWFYRCSKQAAENYIEEYFKEFKLTTLY